MWRGCAFLPSHVRPDGGQGRIVKRAGGLLFGSTVDRRPLLVETPDV
ncbi:MAG: hypothetical protein AB7D33_02535 [Sphingobium sp.]